LSQGFSPRDASGIIHEESALPAIQRLTIVDQPTQSGGTGKTFFIIIAAIILAAFLLFLIIRPGHALT
jgi:hypothetical protein